MAEAERDDAAPTGEPAGDDAADGDAADDTADVNDGDADAADDDEAEPESPHSIIDLYDAESRRLVEFRTLIDGFLPRYGFPSEHPPCDGMGLVDPRVKFAFDAMLASVCHAIESIARRSQITPDPKEFL